MKPLLLRFWGYYQPYRKLFILDFCCAIVAAILELSFPLFVNQVVDKLLPSNNWSLTLLACGGLLVIYFLNAFLGFVVTYWGHMLGINIETDMRSSMFGHIQKLSFRFFDNNKTGHLMSRISTDLMDIGEMAHHGPEDVVVAIMTLIGAFAVMMFIHPPLALMTFAVVPFMIWLGLWFNRKMTKAVRKMFADIADFNSRVENNVSGIRVVQAFANEKQEKKLFAVNNARFRVAKLAAYRIIAWSSSISYLMTRLVSLFV
ncbi:ABC transporter ATP-binding protein, partial [bacterium]